MPNYSYVTTTSSFQPFSMQEMILPFSAYKDAFEKTEEAYTDLSGKADKFKYLSETLPEGSKAREIYEGYANELSTQARDLARNGLSMANRRALTGLKRRYQGEIGRLDLADQAMKEEQKLRRQLNAQDSSRLYAVDNLSIDEFLDNNTPNLYNISGNELYTRGAAAGKAASARIFRSGDSGSTLGGYYRDWVEKMGYSPESINAFRNNAAAIPELQMAADAILEERGVTQNLTGDNLTRARQSVINGIIDGAIYQEKHNPVRDAGVMSAAEVAADSRARQSLDLQKDQFDFQVATSGYVKNPDDTWSYDPTKDLSVQKAAAVALAKGQGNKGKGASYDVRNKNTIMVGAKTGTIYKGNGAEGEGVELDEMPSVALNGQELTDLANNPNSYIVGAIGNNSLSDYEVRVIREGSTELSGTGWLDNDDLNEDVYILVPRESKRSPSDATGNSSFGENDVPE